MGARDEGLSGGRIAVLHTIPLHLLRMPADLMPTRFDREEERRAIPISSFVLGLSSQAHKGLFLSPLR